MKSGFNTLFIALVGCVITLLVASCCNNSEPEPALFNRLYGNVEVLWDAPHTALHGLKGRVADVVSSETYEDNTQVTAFQFDRDGRLSFFNPTGLVEEPTTFSLSSRSPWGPSGTVAYSYSYDQQGRLATIVELEHLAPIVTYSLVYGSHGKYIPLPIPLGNLPLFLIKNLVSVTADDDSFNYSFDGNTASFQSRQWVNNMTTTYTMGKSYPTRKEVVTRRGETILQKEETFFAFGEHGFPLGTTTRTYEEEETKPSKEVIETTAYPFLLPATQKNSLGLTTTQRSWTYNDNGLLIKAQLQSNEGTGNIEITDVNIMDTQIDNVGNYTSMKRVIVGFFNEYWGEGETLLQQSINYYQ